MDVALHWSGEWPEHLQPLLSALESLPEAEDAAEGAVAFCPDAAGIGPPGTADGALVAAVPHPENVFAEDGAGPYQDLLAAWAERGAFFTVPSSSAAAKLRAQLHLSYERVSVTPLPLPPGRIPPKAEEGGQDILALGPISYASVLSAASVLRLAGLEPRVLLAAADAEVISRPGGIGDVYGLLPGREAIAVADWQAAASSAGAILLANVGHGSGWTLREALATGRPVVAPCRSWVRDHLDAVGAAAYIYSDVRTLIWTLASALRRERGAALESAAREAVLSESWERAARGLYATLTAAITQPAARQVNGARKPSTGVMSTTSVSVRSERLRVCVINPKASGGGGEMFMRRIVAAMASHESRPQVTLVCHVEPGAAFDVGLADLAQAGVQTRIDPDPRLTTSISEEAAESDVVYYSWPHGTAPPDVTAPLVCTFHDLNWKHFDVTQPDQKALMEQQTPRWVQSAAAIVHSSEFIRREMRHFYDPPASLLHVIPLAAEVPSKPPPSDYIARTRRRFALPERFLLSPNGRHLHKNYALLEAALRLLHEDGRSVTVVASGPGTDLFNGPDLIGLGYISANELQVLYSECDGVVQTTLYEAGSFPMSEAMAAGKPVAISRIPPIVEQIKRVGVTAELFDPLDPQDAAEALWRLWRGSATTAADTVAANARAVAARTWDDVAGDYLKLFADVSHPGVPSRYAGHSVSR